MSASFHDRSSIPRSPDLSRQSPSGSRTSSVRLSGSGSSQCKPSHIELVPRTNAHATPCAENETLMLPSHDSRPARPPALSPGPTPVPILPLHSAISNQYQPYTPDQDVLRITQLLNQRPISHHPGLSPNPSHQVSSPSALESHALSSSSTRHAAINSQSIRPRTSNQVFNNISDLAAHYGIPQFLPVAPRTTPHRTESEDAFLHQTESLLSSPDFSHLCSNYLTMLSQKPGDNGVKDVPAADVAPESTSMEVTDSEAIRSLMEVLSATPELQMSDDLNEFLTSPLIDSPLDDELLTTPALGSDMNADILTSPLMGDFVSDSFDEFPPLFEGFNDAVFAAPKPSQDKPSASPNPPNFDHMYRLESPNTPLLDSPLVSPFHGKPAPVPAPRKISATGTRKNLLPESLVPIDAPTQTRNYVTPSATSRKELPATWRRKRQRTAGPGEEEDQLGEEVAPSTSEQEQIEAKRRQNTIAARRSRKRKLEYQRELEGNLEHYKRESEMWKQRALTCQALLRSHRIECPEFPDS